MWYAPTFGCIARLSQNMAFISLLFPLLMDFMLSVASPLHGQASNVAPSGKSTKVIPLNQILKNLLTLVFQAVAVFFYFAQLVSLYAYLPEMKRDVGQEKMSVFTSLFQTVQFGTQAGFLVVMAGLAYALKSGPVLSAQVSQGINTLSSMIFLGLGWLKYLGPRKAGRELPEGHSVILEGFRNNFKTMVKIQKDFKKGIRWFFLAITFGQAGTFQGKGKIYTA